MEQDRYFTIYFFFDFFIGLEIIHLNLAHVIDTFSTISMKQHYYLKLST